jgi:ribosome-associated heat shock protein Hsp15
MHVLVRIDKWLWAARFFKTRAIARAAIQGGKVQVNGARTKPSKVLNAGDIVRVQRGEEVFTVVVAGITDRRGPAPEAQKLYRETDESRLRREALAEQRAMQRAEKSSRERRPDKRQRREIIRFRSDSEG